MDADYSVELGPPSEDATLEFPWPAYLDLKRRPELLALVEEAAQYRELRDFLRGVNSQPSLFESAKCDVFSSRELDEAEAIYGACKLGGYVDLVFADDREQARFSFFDHEELAQALVALLKKAPEVSATAELIVRRCYYQATGQKEDVRSGFYFTLYVFGYGEDEDHARRRWQVALQLVGNALLQLSAERRRAQEEEN